MGLAWGSLRLPERNEEALIKSAVSVLVFAKLPVPGRVKTRLVGEVAGRRLGPEETAELYSGFLRDYARRMAAGELGADPCFCLKPGTDLGAFATLIAPYQVRLMPEPSRAGIGARSLGEALAFSVEADLARGSSGVILLGSDLPHLPHRVLAQAGQALERAALVLGNDGGGCYLIAASEPAPVLEEADLPWSQGRDFAELVRRQEAAGRSVEVLPERFEDVDRPADLEALIEGLRSGAIDGEGIPATLAVLRGWGLEL